MKKITLMFLAIALFAAPAFAADLDSKLANTNLSKQVEGAYFVSADGNNYALYTAHTKGNKVFGSSNLSTAIYSKPIAGTSYVSTDLPSADPSAWDSTAFPTGTWTVL